MFIEVTLLDSPSVKAFDVLQQTFWPFDLKAKEAGSLEPGQVGLLGRKVLLGTEYSESPYCYSWEAHMKAWSSDREVLSGKSPLVKSLGLSQSNTVDGVIDATLGLGKDTAHLLTFGAKVMAFERVAEVFFLARASQVLEDFFPERLLLSFGSVKENPENLPIYFDPMFDDGSKRKAKAHKGMSAFHLLVGGDDDAAQEGMRLRNMTSRLVVKRPSKKKALLDNLNSSWKGKAISYDLYL